MLPIYEFCLYGSGSINKRWQLLLCLWRLMGNCVDICSYNSLLQDMLKVKTEDSKFVTELLNLIEVFNTEIY